VYSVDGTNKYCDGDRSKIGKITKGASYEQDQKAETSSCDQHFAGNADYFCAYPGFGNVTEQSRF
jgi:hypothetical protein